MQAKIEKIMHYGNHVHLILAFCLSYQDGCIHERQA
jgi:hypothetical protein